MKPTRVGAAGGSDQSAAAAHLWLQTEPEVTLLQRALHGLASVSPWNGLRCLLYRWGGVKVGAGASIARGTSISPGVGIGARACVRHGAAIGAGARIGAGVEVRHGAYIGPGAEVREGAIVGQGASLRHCTVGAHSFIEQGTVFTGSGDNRIVIGDHSYIGIYAVLDSTGGIEIGDGVHIAGPGAGLWTHTSVYQCLAGNGAPEADGAARAPIKVESSVWIGGHTTLYPGVTIGHHSAVLPNSVVRESVPAGCVVGGVPATLKRRVSIVAEPGAAPQVRFERPSPGAPPAPAAAPAGAVEGQTGPALWPAPTAYTPPGRQPLAESAGAAAEPAIPWGDGAGRAGADRRQTTWATSTARTVVRNATLLSMGQFVTLLLGVVFTSLLARYLGPAGYGQYSLAYSTVAMLMIAVNLGFGTLAVRNISRNREQASRYLTNIVFARAVLAAIAFTAFLLVAWRRRLPLEMTVLVLVAGASLVTDAFTEAIGSVFYAFERMEYNVIGQVVRSVAALGLGALGIMRQWNLVSILALLVAADLLRYGLSLVLLSTRVTTLRASIDLRFCWELLVASLPFALLLTVSALAVDLNVIMLGILRGSTVVGWYSSAIRVLAALLVAPGMFLNAIYPVLSRLHASSERALVLSYRKSYQWGLILGLPLAVGTFFLSGEVIQLVFGPRFGQGIDFLRVLSFVVATSFCNSVNGATLNAIGKEKLFAAISLGSAALIAGVNWVMIPRTGYLWVAYMQGLGNGLGFVIYSLICHRALQVALPWRLGLKVTLATAAMGLLLYEGLRLGMHPLAAMVVGPIAYVVAAYALGVLADDDLVALKQLLRLA